MSLMISGLVEDGATAGEDGLVQVLATKPTFAVGAAMALPSARASATAAAPAPAASSAPDSKRYDSLWACARHGPAQQLRPAACGG